jgi:hypothetical protein
MPHYLLQRILENNKLLSNEFTPRFSINSIQQTQLHTQLHAKGALRNNLLDTAEQHKLACSLHRMKPQHQTMQNNQSYIANVYK